MTVETKVHAPNFLGILEEVLIDEDVEYKKSHEYHYRHNPSSGMVSVDGKRVGACMRALYYKATKEPESNPRDFSNRLTAGFGNAIHQWILDKLSKSKKLSVVPESAGRVSIDGLTKEISFRLDGLVTYRGELGGLEIKTQQGFGLQRMIKDGGPKQSDILQCLSYFGTNEAIMWFGLVYLARDSGYRAEYHIWKEDGKFWIKGLVPTMSTREISDLSFPGIVAQWKKFEEHLESLVIPARDYKIVFADDGRIVPSRIKKGYKYKSDYRCLYCNWQTKCWTSEGAREDSIKVDGIKKNTHAVNEEQFVAEEP